jgi:hypothetical protein
MTNKVETIIAAITVKLKAAGINTVYRWPEELMKVGNRYPLALIKEERQDYIATSGQRYEYVLTITITLVSDAIRERMKYMNALQVTLFNALFADATLGGTVMNINPISVNMGDLIRGSDLSGYAGFNEAASFRTITIQALVQDARV